MARVNVYLPDELARQARDAGLNVSAVTQEALRRALTASETDRWLDSLATRPQSDIAHERVIAAVDNAREELSGRAHG